MTDTVTASVVESRRAWKKIERSGGLYAVSNDGLVRREARGHSTYPGRILLPNKNVDGYPTVALHVNGVQKTTLIHGLVAEAFLGPRPHKHEVNHKNGIKADNRLVNLEWVTRSDNARHAVNVLGRPFGATGEKNSAAKLTWKKVSEIRKVKRSGNVTQRALATKYGVSDATISEILHNKNWIVLPKEGT